MQKISSILTALKLFFTDMKFKCGGGGIGGVKKSQSIPTAICRQEVLFKYVHFLTHCAI